MKKKIKDMAFKQYAPTDINKKGYHKNKKNYKDFNSTNVE